MWNNFFKHIDIKAENTHILDGNAADLQAECEAFEKKIVEAGGIELFVGGDPTTANQCIYTHTHTQKLKFLIVLLRYWTRWPHCFQWAGFQFSVQNSGEDPG